MGGGGFEGAKPAKISNDTQVKAYAASSGGHKGGRGWESIPVLSHIHLSGWIRQSDEVVEIEEHQDH